MAHRNGKLIRQYGEAKGLNRSQRTAAKRAWRAMSQEERHAERRRMRQVVENFRALGAK